MTLPLPPPTHTDLHLSSGSSSQPSSSARESWEQGGLQTAYACTPPEPWFSAALLHTGHQDTRWKTPWHSKGKDVLPFDRCKVNEPQKYHSEQETRCERYVLCVLYETVNQANSPRVTGQCVPGTEVLPAQGHKRLPEVMEMSCILIRTVAAQAYLSVRHSL